ncbi:hypothetical protein L6R21_14300 [bacterium]|nr:hypothetical protein [bacterium]
MEKLAALLLDQTDPATIRGNPQIVVFVGNDCVDHVMAQPADVSGMMGVVLKTGLAVGQKIDAVGIGSHPDILGPVLIDRPNGIMIQTGSIEGIMLTVLPGAGGEVEYIDAGILAADPQAILAVEQETQDGIAAELVLGSG